MRRIWLLVACAALLSSGCAMCPSCDEHAYTAFGGIVERQDPAHGRVGSAFEPAEWGGSYNEQVIVGDIYSDDGYLEDGNVGDGYIEGPYVDGPILEEAYRP